MLYLLTIYIHNSQNISRSITQQTLYRHVAQTFLCPKKVTSTTTQIMRINCSFFGINFAIITEIRGVVFENLIFKNYYWRPTFPVLAIFSQSTFDDSYEVFTFLMT